MKKTGQDKWFFDSIFYQIYPQSFCDSNGDGIGDLEGIISKLDYLSDLGIDAVWLSPIFDSPFKDAGYDVADYKKIAHRYGSAKTLGRLINECHKRKIKILLDFVFNHTSNEHPWFRMSQKMGKNPYSKWYVWSMDPMKYPAGTWANWCSERYDSYYHRFTHYQPDLNYGNPDLPAESGNSPHDPDVGRMRRQLKDIAGFWLDKGVDGFRADVPAALVETFEKMFNAPQTCAFWREMREMIDKNYSGRVMVAEGWEENILGDIRDSHFHISFYLPYVWQLLSFYGDSGNPEQKKGKFFSPQGGDIKWFVNRYLKLQEEVSGHKGSLSLISGSHDMPRLPGVCKHDSIVKCYFAFLLTYPAVPFIYYGDEIGMKYVPDLPSKEGSNYRAGSRTPMQWNNKKNAGFSSAPSKSLYFPVQDDFPERNVENQLDEKKSVLNTVKELIKLRKSTSAFGPFTNIRHLYLEKNSPVYAYSRSDEKDSFLIVLNPSSKSASLVLKGKKGQKLETALNSGGKNICSIINGKINIKMSPMSFIICKHACPV